jgi:urease accessory protein
MKADTARTRPGSARRPWVMTNFKTQRGVAEVVRFIESRGMLHQEAPGQLSLAT